MKKERINKTQPASQNPNQIDHSTDHCQLLTINEVAEKLGISTRTFYRKRKDTDSVIPPIKIGKRNIRYKLSDVLNFIERGGLNAH